MLLKENAERKCLSPIDYRTKSKIRRAEMTRGILKVRFSLSAESA